ncbi:MAG: hypothetical protein KGD64_03585 [Candidatus Heimdallarchaeota archaeon]|nr:hypothetical protein [Candidatus Heimdallarchaeota archaeon]
MKNRIIISLIISSIILLHPIPNTFSTTFAQSAEQAEIVIRQASDKLKTIFNLLEDLKRFDADVRDIVLQTDDSLQLINEAKQLFSNAQYDLSIEKANQALTQLEGVEEEIEEINKTVVRESWLIYSIIGVMGAIASIGFVFLFIKKIYPWYKNKLLEEYGNLEIVYNKEKEG